MSWERAYVDDHWPTEAIAPHIRTLLELIGEDPQREGLRDTPRRVARMLAELTSGYRVDPDKLLNGALFSTNYDGMVMVRDMEFYSLCEHHLLPFFGTVHVAYVPNGKIIGLSKIPRIVDMFARRLQVQENLTAQIADFIEQVIQPRGVAVAIDAAHMCAIMRGVRKEQARMVTQVMRGVFLHDASLRQEWQNWVQQRTGILPQLPGGGA